MRASKYLIATVKETPADAEVISHQLMLRAGLIRKLTSGMYTWLPLGVRVLQKVSRIVREEMNRAGAMELSMPVVQNSELWQESGRWDAMGPELLRFTDRHDRDFCLGPTHEEVITDLVRNEYSSYRQLPANLYQIQTKFRDERRPRFGVMRSREFIMKDAYSFHTSQDCLQATYEVMHQTYCTIFERMGLNFRPVVADSGAIGGNTSHEFHVLAESGEDEIVFSDGSDYAANIEMAVGEIPPAVESTARAGSPDRVNTGDAQTIDEIAERLAVDPKQIVKTLIVQGADEEGQMSDTLVALLLRGDQVLNETKAAKLAGIFSPLKFAEEDAVLAAVGCKPGSLGPVAMPLRVVADPSVVTLVDFVCGANAAETHLRGANWNDEIRYDEVCDIRNVQEGDISPDGKGRLAIKRGIEVGHIFQLGTKYSEAMNAKVLDEQGRAVTMTMGCYGIGVTRVVAACIEQFHDDKGIIWPESIAPFDLVIVQIDAHKSAAVGEFAEMLYQRAAECGLEALLDDRDKKTSPGVKFADSELMGIPHRIVVSPRTLADEQVEYMRRDTREKQLLSKAEIVEFLDRKFDRQAS